MQYYFVIIYPCKPLISARKCTFCLATDADPVCCWHLIFALILSAVSVRHTWHTHTQVLELRKTSNERLHVILDTIHHRVCNNNLQYNLTQVVLGEPFIFKSYYCNVFVIVHLVSVWQIAGADVDPLWVPSLTTGYPNIWEIFLQFIMSSFFFFQFKYQQRNYLFEHIGMFY